MKFCIIYVMHGNKNVVIVIVIVKKSLVDFSTSQQIITLDGDFKFQCTIVKIYQCKYQ